MDTTATESALLSKLQSSTDLTGIYNLFAEYLHPFKPHLEPKRPSSKPTKTLDSTTTRSLAKQFLPFLNKSLSLLPKRLASEAESQSLDKISHEIVLELFSIYRLCISCLDLISSQLSCKPYSVHVQRVRFVHCLEGWRLCEEAEVEGFLVLESLRGICFGKLGAKAGKLKTQLVPRLSKENQDQDFALVIVEVVVTLVKCALMNRSKEEANYKRILALVDEAAPWFKILDASAYERFQRVLVSYLNKIALFMVSEIASFSKDLVLRFFELSFSEYGKSSIKDQIYKFALRVCSCIFSRNNSVSLSTIDILQYVLSSVAAVCEVEVENTVLEFLELVCYSANKCQTTTPTICCAVAELLSKLADSQAILPLGPILRLYAAGLSIFSFNGQLQNGESAAEIHTKDASGSQIFIDYKRLVQKVPISLDSLKDFFAIGGKINELSQKVMAYLPSYYKALEFLCEPLAEFVYAKRREILGERDGASFITNLVIAQEAFHEFGCVHYHSIAEKRNLLIKNGSDESKTIIHIAVAGFTLSLRTGRYIKESVNLLNGLISNDGVQVNGLKYLFAWLYNIAVVLYRNKKLKEASKALKLSCKASWNRLVYHCQSNEFHGDTIDDASRDFAKGAKDFITESCEKTVFLLDLLYEGSRHKMNTVLKDSLEKWSTAENIVKSLPPPYLLVKHWVKIRYKLLLDGDVEQRTSTLYSLLSSSTNMSRRTLGILLELELIAYKAMNSFNPRVCQKMCMEIIDTLLEKVYVSNDNYVQKSRILIAKAGELRGFGVERLEECIQHLSGAVSALGDVCSGNANCNSQAHHLMASALCLRALCSHERVQPNPKVLLLKRLVSSIENFEDIENAVNLWLCPYECHAGARSTTMLESVLELLHDNDQSEIIVKDMLNLVYHVLDFLSIKGYTEIHSKIFEILIRLCKWRKLPLDKVLTIFWESRRIGHALCASPMHESFFSRLSEHYGEISNCSRFWLKCMKLSKPLLVGFQQSFFSSLAVPLQGSFCREISSLFEENDDVVKLAGCDLVCPVSVDEVQLVASDLISNVPISNTSAFLSAYLYYDLSDQLILKGQVIQALASAKESHRLRSKLFQETFRCSVDQGTECNGKSANGTQNHCYAIGSLHIHNQVAYEAWGSGIPGDFKCGILSPWIVLRCYLESTLQVGTIQEILGNGIEAESLLSWGKTISLHQCLPLYVISFSFLLGKLYRKQMLWELAEKELKAASQILDENREMISCLKCRMFLEISIYQQLGDLFRNRSCGSTGNPSMEMLSRAGEMYKSALHILNFSKWKNSISSSEEAITDQAERSCAFNCKMDQLNTGEIASKIGRPNVKAMPKRFRKTKKDNAPSTNGLRMTRSRSRALENSAGTVSNHAETGSTINSKSDHLFSETCAVKQRGHASESSSSLVDCVCEITRLCNKMKCWHCLALQVIRTLSLDDLVHMKWELIWRRLSMMLLIGIGKCLIVLNENHKAHQILLLSTSVLLNPLCPKYSSLSYNSLIDLIGKDVLVDALAIEQAVLLYNICQIALESYGCKFSRGDNCQFSCIGIPKIVSWLKLAFVLCSQIPLLFQKVSRLLAVLHVLSTSVRAFSLSTGTALSESHWAAFFHQASIGNNINQLLFSRLMQKAKSKDTGDLQGSLLSSSVPSATQHLLRVVAKLQDLDEFILRFYQKLPCSTVICISMFGGSDANLLRELLCCPSAQGWILLSRLNSNSQPVLILLPVDSVFDESSVDMVCSNTGISYEGKDLIKQWHCPWVSSVVDEAAPIFKAILKENYMSSSIYPEEDTKQNRILWWSQRERLDHCLGKFLRGLEDSWLGPWKYLLLGHWSDNNHLSSLERKLIIDLRLRCKATVSKDLLRVILIGAMHASEIREHGLQLILNKGCFIGGSCKELSNSSSEVKSLSMEVFQMVFEGDHALEDIEQPTRSPVILVLDSDIQMLPWESLPILRNEEVYRMPSVTSICATLDRCCHHQELLNGGAEVFPLIDPLNSFYLLNPSGDLSRTQVEFENWFRDQNFEGKTGTAPTIEELVGTLKTHDLFIYFGHGSGAQYIPGHEIEKLEGCAATLLMGCSSGCLSINGHYAPQGAPLSYLLAGSPVIVANLWEVTDKDIDRFGKAVLDAWLRERSNSTRCSECDMLLDKFESIRISEAKGNGKEKGLRSKSYSTSDVNVCTNFCNHRPKVGFFMGQARKACNLPFLIGASPVCYGVPTGITKKKEL